jgi:hypothetical protein
METERKHNSLALGKIKRTLDPAYSYVIFEKTSVSANEEKFQEIFDAISRLKLAILDWKIHHDRVERIALLVVKVNPGRTDKILEEFVNAGMPKDIIFYSFGSRVGI